MDIERFFYSGGIVKCEDRTESDVVIQICIDAGFPVYKFHNPNSHYHGVYYDKTSKEICFYLNGSYKWSEGISFKDWMKHIKQDIMIEDLI